MSFCWRSMSLDPVISCHEMSTGGFYGSLGNPQLVRGDVEPPQETGLSRDPTWVVSVY